MRMDYTHASPPISIREAFAAFSTSARGPDRAPANQYVRVDCLWRKNKNWCKQTEVNKRSSPQGAISLKKFNQKRMNEGWWSIV